MISLQGEYVIRFDLNLLSSGGINDIGINYGSFFMPIERQDNRSIVLKHGLDIMFYLRNTHTEGQLIRDVFKPFEEQAEMAISSIRTIIIPLIEKLDQSLETYLSIATEFDKMFYKSLSYTYIPWDHIEETVLAYLYKEKKNKAEETAIMFQEYLKRSIDLIRKNNQLPEKVIISSITQHKDTMIKLERLIERMNKNGIRELTELAYKRHDISLAETIAFFRTQPAIRSMVQC